MKPIRDHTEYEAALARIDALMSASEGSPEADELEVLAILVEKFEEEHYPIPEASASEVLRLIMEENGLNNKAMARYLGSPSTVSKVLSGSRELTLEQIRILNKALKIPVAALVGRAPAPETGVDPSAFPLVEMARRGLFGEEFLHTAKKELLTTASTLIETLLGVTQLDFACQPQMRQGIKPGPAGNPYAVKAWLLELALQAQAKELTSPYRTLSKEDARNIARLSQNMDGVQAAIKYLEDRGVPVVVVPHYTKSKVDGGVVVFQDGRPAIGLSLRYDRLDYFWFTLLHEVAHIVLGHVQGYLGEESVEEDSNDRNEQEANALVHEVTIPVDEFNTAVPDPSAVTIEKVVSLAQHYGISVAIVAGRVRFASKDYRKFTRFIGSGTVRNLLAKAA